MSTFYGPAHRALQAQHGTERLADRLEAMAHAEFDPAEQAFIEGANMFFLSTVDEHGRPTVSYKGGAVGFVRLAGAGELMFPSFDGNGMFLSLGNLVTHAPVGLLFIDFEHPHRLRVQGTARLDDSPQALQQYPGAQHVVRVRAEQIFVNCGRYIHKADRLSLSPHVPDALGRQPFPAWKRIDAFGDCLPAADAARVDAMGGAVSIDDYRGEELPASS